MHECIIPYSTCRGVLTAWFVVSEFDHWARYQPVLYLVIVISRARGMYGIYCTEARGHEAARGLSAINAIHPEYT